MELIWYLEDLVTNPRMWRRPTATPANRRQDKVFSVATGYRRRGNSAHHRAAKFFAGGAGSTDSVQ
jgi:hypothetical protein